MGGYELSIKLFCSHYYELKKLYPMNYPSEPHPELRMDTRQIRILLVEDDHDAIQIIEGLISIEGDAFEIESVDNLALALNRTGKGDIDLILLDLALPDSQKLDTLISMQQNSPNLPIVVLTGSNDESLALKAVQLGAQDYLFKGQFSSQLLTRSVRYAIERKRAETALRQSERRLRQARDELEVRVQKRTSELQQLSHRLVEVQEQERRSIARELHDEVGQILTGLNMNLELIKRMPAETIVEGIAQTQLQVSELLARVRDISLNLRPAMLDHLGLLPALFWHFDRYTVQTKVQVSFKHASVEGRYSPELETAVYRIVQEALTNAARHSKATEVTVMLWATAETISVQIEDQGAGFQPETVMLAGRSSGLTGMRERAALLNGRLIIESSPGSGTCVTAELPLTKLES